jgi:hypothetical protein
MDSNHVCTHKRLAIHIGDDPIHRGARRPLCKERVRWDNAHERNEREGEHWPCELRKKVHILPSCLIGE